MKTRLIKALGILLVVSMLSTACGWMSAPVTESVVPQGSNVPASDVNEASTREVPQSRTGDQSSAKTSSGSLSYPVVDTAQDKCYDDQTEVACPMEGQAYFGQDAQYAGAAPRYQDNGDGTVTDLVTGLMWQGDHGEKMTYAQAATGASAFSLAGYSDWRLPTIKELYSLILFDGMDVSACPGGTCSATPFIDTRYFNFSYGDAASGERVIDSQFATSTLYTSTTMNGAETMFGVNFADGRIKGYPTEKTFYVLYVRGNPGYGQNSFIDNGNGTISDHATGLTWTQSDSGSGMDWEAALNYCESLDFAGATDWRLPDVKELQSLVDYSRSPATTSSAAIDPIFNTTAITDETGKMDFPFYWSSTTHVDSSGRGAYGAYISFGEALGYMREAWIDVHGAGAQRSDPKSGDVSQYPQGHGPQGDAARVENYVRCVRGGGASLVVDGVSSAVRPSMPIESMDLQQNQPRGMPDQGGQPPQKALDACVGLSQGSACAMITPDGALAGSCMTVLSGQLACAPAGGLPEGGPARP